MAKILVIDDSAAIRQVVRTALEIAGHRILEASSGREGIDLAQANQDVQLIIADHNMPGMDGLTMCQKIREIPGLSRVPMIMLTTERSRDLMLKGKEIGLTGWITKPFEPTKALPVIGKLIA